MIADVHANVPALEAVLADIAEQGADEIVVNGDLVNRGPGNAEVLERVLNLPNLSAMTLGNHDDLMRKWIDRDPDIPELWFEDAFLARYGVARTAALCSGADRLRLESCR